MYCLDSNILIEILRGNGDISSKIFNVLNEEFVFSTYISLCELYKGAYISNKTEKSLDEINKLCNFLEFVSLDLNSSKEFGKLYVKLMKSGKIIPEADLLIASICKANNLTLITRDKKHFNNLGVKVLEW